MGAVDDGQQSQWARSSSARSRYAIRVQGHLDPRWSEWLEGMTVTHEDGGMTRLEGPVRDQSALRGLLNRLWDLHLTLVTVERLGSEVAPSTELPETAP